MNQLIIIMFLRIKNTNFLQNCSLKLIPTLFPPFSYLFSSKSSNLSFRSFAKTLIEIQNISSMTSKKQIFTAYYTVIPPDERQKINQIMSFVENKPQTGVSNKILTNFLGKNYLNMKVSHADLEEIIDNIYEEKSEEKKQMAEQDRGAFKNEIYLDDVIEVIENLQKIEGLASIEKKMNIIKSMLDRMQTIEQIRIFLRIMTKNLRIGLKEKSMNLQMSKNEQHSTHQNHESVREVNDPSSFRGRNEKEEKKKLKQWSETEAFDGQLMLAKPLKTINDLWDFCDKKMKDYEKQENPSSKILADLKYDGERTLLTFQKGKRLSLISRRKKSQTQIYTKLSETIEKELNQIPHLNSIKLDGEIVCINQKGEHMPMQFVLGFRGKQLDSSFLANNNQKLNLFVFDVLEYNGEDLTSMPLLKRRQKLPQTSTMKPSLCRSFNYPEQKSHIVEYFMEVLKQKYEGLMIKGQLDKYYKNGSRKYWGKLKKGCRIEETETGEIDLDLVVMGVEMGKGKKSNGYASFLLGAHHEGKLYPITKVGSGFSDQLLLDLNDLLISRDMLLAAPTPEMVVPKMIRVHSYVKPELVFQVKCQDITRSPSYSFSYKQDYGGISLRFPVFECLRDDKDPKDCRADVLLELAKDV